MSPVHIAFSVFLVCAIWGERGFSAGNQPTDILSGVSRIAFLGDSLTDGSSYPDYVLSTLQQQFPGRRFDIVNAGVCGDSARRLLARLKGEVIDRRPDLAVVCIGTNDALGRRPLAEYKADLSVIVKRLKDAHSKVMLLLPSPLTVVPLDGYLDVIRAVAQEQNVALGDAHSEFLRAQKEGKQPMGPDGIHHGPDGFPCMAKAILVALGLPDVAPVTTLKPWPSLLTMWEESDPLAFNGKPETLNPADARNWKPFVPDRWVARLPWHDQHFIRRGAWLPFHAESPSREIARFGRVVYKADKSGVVELQVGGGGKMVVWVNGEKVGVPTKPRYHADAERTRVTVKEGDNEIVVWCSFLAFIGVREISD